MMHVKIDTCEDLSYQFMLYNINTIKAINNFAKLIAVLEIRCIL